MDFTIVRDQIVTEGATTGHLYAGDLDLCTLELPWKENVVNVSCIPTGRYEVVIAYSHRFKRQMPRILNVPSRDGILIHPLNEVDQTEGCIGVGMTRSPDEQSIGDSRKAFASFFRWLSDVLGNDRAYVEVSYAS